MLKQITLTTATVSLMALGACTTTGNTEKGAAIGAATGAVVGAVIGNNTGSGDAGTGAAIGAVVGGVGGAVIGHEKDKKMNQHPGNYQSGSYPSGNQSTSVRHHTGGQQLYYDNQTGRYYYFDQTSGKTYYENGDFRG